MMTTHGLSRMRSKRWFLCPCVPLWLAASCMAFLGCAQPIHLIHAGTVIRNHVIVIDGQGVPRDPTVPGGQKLEVQAFRDQIADMFSAMHKFHEGQTNCKVLLFVHGGLNLPASSLEAADKEIDRILQAGYYPIFLNWNSGLLDTYGEHVTRITQGQTDDGMVRKLLSPLYVFADIGRALTRAPVVWANQIGTDVSAAGADLNALPKQDPISNGTSGGIELESQRWANMRQGEALTKVFQRLRGKQIHEEKSRSKDEPRQEIRLYIGPDMDVDRWHLASLEIKYILTSPAKFGLSWLIDGLGSPAWANMSRRTLMAFDGQLAGNPIDAVQSQQPDVLQSRGVPREQRAAQATDFTATGAFAVFRDKLLDALEEEGSMAGTVPPTPGARHYELTLVGHSMGTMVLNEWLRRDVLEQRKLVYANIVYMAAACSVRDFGRSVVPYLLQHRPNPAGSNLAEVSGTQFYNLMLHPLADLRERERAFDIPPRGSLLVWLDDFLGNPQSPLDRTLGRWDNIIPATDLIPQKIRGQVTLKAFALAPYDDAAPPKCQPDYGPQAHGQFRERPYWFPSFWYSESPVVPPDATDSVSARPFLPSATNVAR